MLENEIKLHDVVRIYTRELLPGQRAGEWLELLGLLHPNEIIQQQCNSFAAQNVLISLLKDLTLSSTLHSNPRTIYSAFTLHPPRQPKSARRMALPLFGFLINYCTVIP